MKNDYDDFKHSFTALFGGRQGTTVFLDRNYTISSFEDGSVGFRYYKKGCMIRSNCPPPIVYQSLIKNEDVYELLKQY